MNKVTSKPHPTRPFAPRETYLNGVLIGHIREVSDHFRGRDTSKALTFTPVDGLPFRLPPMRETGWTKRHMHRRIEDTLADRAARIELFIGYVRSLVTP